MVPSSPPVRAGRLLLLLTVTLMTTPPTGTIARAGSHDGLAVRNLLRLRACSPQYMALLEGGCENALSQHYRICNASRTASHSLLTHFCPEQAHHHRFGRSQSI
jgi:hypothetical protein